MRFWNPSCRYWKSKRWNILPFSTAVLVRHSDRVIRWSTFGLLRIPALLFIISSRKVKSFLNKMNPTDAQMASYIDNLCDKQWPEGSPEVTSPKPHRSSQEKNETKDRAQHLINARCTGYTLFFTLINTAARVMIFILRRRCGNCPSSLTSCSPL